MITFVDLVDIFYKETGKKYSFVDKNGYTIPESVHFEFEQEILSVDFENKVVKVNATIAELSPDEKFYFEVGTSTMDGYSRGYLLLTQKEADIIVYASNQDNWTDYDDGDGYSGTFTIFKDKPIPVSDFEKGVR